MVFLFVYRYKEINFKWYYLFIKSFSKKFTINIINIISDIGLIRTKYKDFQNIVNFIHKCTFIRQILPRALVRMQCLSK